MAQEPMGVVPRASTDRSPVKFALEEREESRREHLLSNSCLGSGDGWRETDFL